MSIVQILHEQHDGGDDGEAEHTGQDKFQRLRLHASKINTSMTIIKMKNAGFPRNGKKWRYGNPAIKQIVKD